MGDVIRFQTTERIARKPPAPKHDHASSAVVVVLPVIHKAAPTESPCEAPYDDWYYR
jgi:hypothetical protein